VLACSGRRRPRVCYVPVASGDHDDFITSFYAQYPASRCEATHVELVRGVPRAPAEVLAAQDVVYVGGGSTPILVAALRVHGLDRVLAQLWRDGRVLCGDSAGAYVWFQGCITDSLGPDLRPFADGLGFLPGSCVAHADERREGLLIDALAAGRLPGPGWAIGDGTALVFRGTAHVETVTGRPGGRASRLDLNGTGPVSPVSPVELPARPL
jgi:hypothetical protein